MAGVFFIIIIIRLFNCNAENTISSLRAAAIPAVTIQIRTWEIGTLATNKKFEFIDLHTLRTFIFQKKKELHNIHIILVNLYYIIVIIFVIFLRYIFFYFKIIITIIVI